MTLNQACCAGQDGLSTSDTVATTEPFAGFTENSKKKRKKERNQWVAIVRKMKNASLGGVGEVRGKQTDWFETIEKQQLQIATSCKHM